MISIIDAFKNLFVCVFHPSFIIRFSLIQKRPDTKRGRQAVLVLDPALAASSSTDDDVVQDAIITINGVNTSADALQHKIPAPSSASLAAQAASVKPQFAVTSAPALVKPTPPPVSPNPKKVCSID